MRIFLTSILVLLTFCSSAAQSDPDAFLKARALIEHHELDSAKYFLNIAVQEKPSDLDIRYQRGMLFFDISKYDEAKEDFLIVNQKYRGKAGFMLAKIEVRLHHEEIAIKYLREHLSSKYKLAEKDILLDKDLSMMESHSGWKALWKEKEWYNHYDQQFQESIYLKSLEKYPEAIDILNDLNKKGYKRSKVHLEKADIYQKTGNLKAATNEAEQAVKSDYKNIEARKLQVRIYVETEKFEEARIACEKLLQLAPATFEYYLISGELNSILGNYPKAVNDVSLYLQLFPKNANAHYMIGTIHFDNKKYLGAIKSFNTALDIDKSKEEFYLMRGKSYAITGTNTYANKDFSMALDLNPYNAETWFAKGLVDIELGDNNAACFAFKKALQYGNYDAREYIDKLCGN